MTDFSKFPNNPTLNPEWNAKIATESIAESMFPLTLDTATFFAPKLHLKKGESFEIVGQIALPHPPMIDTPLRPVQLMKVKVQTLTGKQYVICSRIVQTAYGTTLFNAQF